MQITNSTNIYPLVETFHSIQGEGYWMGVSAFFIRLAGCDVHCSWCDTKHSWKVRGHPSQSVDDIVQQARKVNPAIVVITGGEPLMHNLQALTQGLHQQGLKVHLETSGAHPLSGEFDWITLSPKTFKPPCESIYKYTNELKLVVASESDLVWAESQARRVAPETLLYLQSEWQTPSSGALVYNYVLQHPQWRISVQTHKFLSVR